MLPSGFQKVRAFSVISTEPITIKDKTWFRFIFKSENKEAHFDVGDTKEEVEGFEKIIEDFINDRSCETLVVEYSQEKKKLHFWKFETNEKALKFLDGREVTYNYIT